ncbi:MAG TPA: glycosyltransferase family 9 protein [Firmicutes bacterium]|nr:glycosyltransferase family 9 protein [Bacillota bacterium]
MKDLRQTEKEININRYKRILIIRLSAIGDVIETLPAVHALRQRRPNAYIGWILEEASYSLLQGHPEIDRFFIFPKKEIKNAVRQRNFKKVKNLLDRVKEELKQERFDLALDMHNLFKSGVVALLSGAEERIGYGRYREGSRFFLTRQIPPPKSEMHFVDWQMNLVQRLGVEYRNKEFILPDFSKEEQTIRGFLADHKITERYFCLAPGTSWPNKCWTAQGMAAIADRLSAYGKVVLIGSTQDKALAEEVSSLMKTRPVDAVEKLNLREVAVLLRQAELYIGGDTGPMHLAVAVGTQVVAWFGPTSPAKTGPYQENAAVIQAGYPCQPCLKRRCKSMVCLRGLSAETVWERIQPLL